MAAGQGVENYIEISDFTAGIQSAYLSSSTTSGPSNQDGACQMTETYGCFGGRFGGLHPAPRLVASGTQTLFDSNTARYPAGKVKAQILAVHLASPVWPKAGSASTDGDTTTLNFSGEPDQLFVGYQWYYDGTGATTTWNRKYRLETYKLYRSSPTAYTVASSTDNQYGGTQIAYASEQRLFGHIGIDATRSNLTIDTQPGMAHVVYTMGDYTRNAVAGAWPGPSTIQTDAGATSTAVNFNQTCIAHQGRVVFIENFSIQQLQANVFGQAFGANGAIAAGESIGYSDPNAFIASNIKETQQLFVEENPTGFGTWQSMNANELFLVKQRGGGVVVRGDVARPTVVRIPGLPSVYGATNKGCLTDKGYVYGSRSGVYRWNGADTAEDISPQMGGPYGGWFWKPEDNSTDDLFPGALNGTFTYAPPFVVAPNNFMFDTETNAWWRIYPVPSQNSTNGVVFAHWQTSTTGKFYGVPAYISATQTRLWSRFDPNFGANKFVWRSQPLAKTRNRTLNMREINIAAQGLGTVTVDVIGAGGVSVSKTFTINDANRPVIQFAPIKIQAQDVEIRITSESTGSSVNAPVVHRIAIGHNAASSVSH